MDLMPSPSVKLAVGLSEQSSNTTRTSGSQFHIYEQESNLVAREDGEDLSFRRHITMVINII